MDCNCIGCENREDSGLRLKALKKSKVKKTENFSNKLEARKILNSNQNKFEIKLTLKLGCKCKNSKCSKKYCECFHNGLSCSPKCQCSNCLNSKIAKGAVED